MTDLVNVRNKETGAIGQLSDEPGVLEWYAGRGWERYDPPAEKPFVPAHSPAGEPVPEFVTLHHAGIQASHEFPNNAEALAGATDSGWLPPKPPAPEPKPRKQAAPKAEPMEKDVSSNG
jgi:hypothetical protein